ncbi:MAG: hypothetical protein GTO60_19055, partial [Gammaproteobacteria bacterium]|nr:hypothetical protein [Gammaproteobacteria bacterium]
MAAVFKTCSGVCHTIWYNKDGQSNTWHYASTFHADRKGISASTAYDTADYSNDLVVDYRFENNLKDEHMWNLHGHWTNGSGSYVAGKVGNAIQINDNPVEVGAEQNVWDSTNEGLTGNSSKITEMKYNMTLEA